LGLSTFITLIQPFNGDEPFLSCHHIFVGSLVVMFTTYRKPKEKSCGCGAPARPDGFLCDNCRRRWRFYVVV
jgi:hypothetical protein